jgi:hypothetical protein
MAAVTEMIGTVMAVVDAMAVTIGTAVVDVMAETVETAEMVTGGTQIGMTIGTGTMATTTIMRMIALLK